MGATSEQFDLWVALRMKDQGLKAGLSAVSTSAAGAKAQIGGLDKVASKAGSTFKWLAGAAGFAGITGTILKGAQKFAEYERGMLKVQTMLGKGQDVFAMYGSGISDLSRKYATGTSEITAGLYQALSANVDTSKAMQFMDVASKMAIGGFTDTATAVDGLTTVMNAYGYSMGSASHVANVFAVTQKAAKTTIGQMAAQMGTVAPIAAQFGVAFEDVAAALGVSTKRGIPMATAAATLRQVIAGLVAPPRAATKALRDLGVVLDGNTLKQRGLIGTLTYVQEKLKGNNVLMRRLLGTEAMAMAGLLTSAGGLRDFAALADEARTNVGELDAATATMSSSVEHKLKRMELAFGSVTKKIGQSFFEQLGMFDRTEEKVLEFADTLGKAFGTLAKNMGYYIDQTERLFALWLTVKGAKAAQAFLGRYAVAGVAAAGATMAAGGAMAGAATYDPMTNRTMGAAPASFGSRAAGFASKAVGVAAGLAITYEVASIIAGYIETKSIQGMEREVASKGAVSDLELMRRTTSAGYGGVRGELTSRNLLVSQPLVAERERIQRDIELARESGDMEELAFAKKSLEMFDESLGALLSTRTKKYTEELDKLSSSPLGWGTLSGGFAGLLTVGEQIAQSFGNVGVNVKLAIDQKVALDKGLKPAGTGSVRARIDRGEGQARLVSPEYRMTLVREGSGGLFVQPLQDDVIDVTMLDARG